MLILNLVPLFSSWSIFSCVAVTSLVSNYDMVLSSQILLGLMVFAGLPFVCRHFKEFGKLHD